MSGHAETFVAYERVCEGPARGESHARLEMAVSYDIAAEVDERNGWKDDIPTADELADEIEAASRQLREFILFCWEGISLDDSAQFELAVRRLCAVVFALCPDVLCSEVVKERGEHGKFVVVQGTPITLAALSRQPLIHCDPKTMKRLAAQFFERVNDAAAA